MTAQTDLLCWRFAFEVIILPVQGVFADADIDPRRLKGRFEAMISMA